MSKLVKVLAVVAVLMSSVSVVSAEDDVSFGLSLDYFGKYVWRGQDLTDDPVFQPGISMTYGNLTASLWGSMDTTNVNGNSGDFSELDYSVDCSGELTEGVGYSVGVIYYDFPGTTAPDTTELYWGFSFDLPLSPSVTVYHDIDEADGMYVSVGVGHGFAIGEETEGSEPLSLDVSASIGWGDSDYNAYYWGASKSEWNDFGVSAALPLAMGEWTLTPSVTYAMIVDDAVRSLDTYDTDSDYLFFGVSLSTEF